VGYGDKIDANKKILWLMEPPVISPQIYESAINQRDRVHKVFTFVKDLCELFPNFYYYPWGTSFLKKEDQIFHPKTKNTSIIASSKGAVVGQRLRHTIIERYGAKFDGIKQGEPREYKLPWMRDYRFSVAVENSIVDGYFTEKIVDCFRAGTIPIYWGDPSVADIFNPEGVLFFQNLEELDNILDNATEEFYNERYEAVKDNYDIAEKYICPAQNLSEAGLKEEQ
jgi:hypothetical protein